METYPLPSQTISLALFINLKNSNQIKNRLINASMLPDDEEGNLERSKLEFTFIDASMITSRLHILTAVQQALILSTSSELKTNSINSEILFTLDPATNISDSLKHFGISNSTTALLVVSIGKEGSEPDPDDEDDLLIRIKDVVKGDLSEIDELGKLKVGQDGTGGTNVKLLKKVYKLNTDKILMGVTPGSEEERNQLDQLCIAAVALQPVAA